MLFLCPLTLRRNSYRPGGSGEVWEVRGLSKEPEKKGLEREDPLQSLSSHLRIYLTFIPFVLKRFQKRSVLSPFCRWDKLRQWS